MKNNFIIITALLLTVSTFSMCKPYCEVLWNYPAAHLFRFNKSTSYEMNKNGVELDIKFDISSDVVDDAYLVLYAAKEHPPDLLEGFKDSLKIDGFHIRSCFIPNSYYSDEVLTPVDYPVYFKKTAIRKGKNLENFKIIFPRNIKTIKEKVVITTGLVRYNDEIENKIELGLPRDYIINNQIYVGRWHFNNYQKIFFETFPDSSKISLAFSNFDFLLGYSILANGEAPKISKKTCRGKHQPPTYSNFGSFIIQLNQ